MRYLLFRLIKIKVFCCSCLRMHCFIETSDLRTEENPFDTLGELGANLGLYSYICCQWCREKKYFSDFICRIHLVWCDSPHCVMKSLSGFNQKMCLLTDEARASVVFWLHCSWRKTQIPLLVEHSFSLGTFPKLSCSKCRNLVPFYSWPWDCNRAPFSPSSTAYLIPVLMSNLITGPCTKK